MKPNIEKFLNHMMDKSKSFKGGGRWGDNTQFSSLVAEYLSSLSSSDFKKLVSDKHWNSYPSYICSYGEQALLNPRRFGTQIFCAIKILAYSNPKLKSDLIKSAEGIFRMGIIKHSLGADKIKAAKIGLKSSDVRVRKLAVNLLPVRDVEKHLPNEKDKDVMCRIEKRIGYLNMLDHELNSEYRWNRSRAAANAGFNPDLVRDHIQKKDAGGGNRYYDRDIFASMVYNIDSSSAAFYLDIFKKLSGCDESLKKAFLIKLSGKSDV
jgi:hypothetical protein